MDEEAPKQAVSELNLDSANVEPPSPEVPVQSKPRRPRASKAASAKASSKLEVESHANDIEKPKKGKSAPAPWTFPKNSLEDALVVPRSIEEQNAGNPMKSDMLVKAVGFSTVNDWRFLELLRSANQYGLVEGSGRHATVKLTDIGQDIVAPSTPKARQTALIKAFHNVEQFAKVDKFYSGKKLPEDEFFENTLFRNFSVARDRVKTFIDIFTINLNFLHSFSTKRRTPAA